MEQPPKTPDEKPVEVHAEAVPGGPAGKEEGVEGIEMTPVSYDARMHVVNMKIGDNYEVKTFRTNEDGDAEFVDSDEFKEGEGKVFFREGYFYKVYDKSGKFLGQITFTDSELKKLKNNPNDPAVQKMVVGKALAAQVEAIDEQTEQP